MMPNRRNWDQAAAIVWPVLTAAARERKLLTYSDISPLIKTNPLSVGRALDPVQIYCFDSHLPPLTAIVVGKVTGVPGAGFTAWDVDNLADAFEVVFNFDWAAVENPFTVFTGGASETTLAAQLIDTPNSAGDVYTLIKTRGIAQRIFRRALIDLYRAKCCMCDISFENMLEAAHIVPWSECDVKRRLDVRNGILLCANHHRMYDNALISIDADYNIEYCDPAGSDGEYTSADKLLSIDLHGKRIALPSNPELRPDKDALARRREIGEWD